MFDKVTLFYSNITGKIKCYCTGEQTLDYFGEDKEDYNYSYIVVEYDSFIVSNIDKFIIENGELVFIQPTSNYRLR